MEAYRLGSQEALRPEGLDVGKLLVAEFIFYCL
jgi:hypothetical protein